MFGLHSVHFASTFGPSSVHVRSMFGPFAAAHWPNMGTEMDQIGPNMERKQGRAWAKHGPKWAEPRTEMGRTWAELDGTWREAGPNVDRTRAEHRPNTNPVRSIRGGRPQKSLCRLAGLLARGPHGRRFLPYLVEIVAHAGEPAPAEPAPGWSKSVPKSATSRSSELVCASRRHNSTRPPTRAGAARGSTEAWSNGGWRGFWDVPVRDLVDEQSPTAAGSCARARTVERGNSPFSHALHMTAGPRRGPALPMAFGILCFQSAMMS